MAQCTTAIERAEASPGERWVNIVEWFDSKESGLQKQVFRPLPKKSYTSNKILKITKYKNNNQT